MIVKVRSAVDVATVGKGTAAFLPSEGTMKTHPDKPATFGHAHCEAIFLAMGDAVTVQDRDFRIVYQNPAMQALIGDRVGSFCYSAYEGNTAVCPGCPVQKCFADGGVHKAERNVTIKGELRVVENTASPIRDEDGRIIASVEVVRDVTSRKHTEHRLTCFMNMYAALSHTNKAIMESASREEMFGRVCSAAVKFGKFSLAIIGLIDPEGVVRSVAHCGAASRYLDNLVVLADARKEEGRGPTGRAICEGIPYVCNNFHSDPITTPWRIAAQKHGILASAAFPLRHQGSVVGALKVYSEQAGFFDREMVDLLTEMSANISFAFDNFSREEQRAQSVEALRKSEEQLKLVLEGSNEGYCDWHIPSATVRMSGRYLEMLGYGPEELEQIPGTIKRLIHPEDWPRVNTLIDEELASRHPAFEIDVRVLAKDGEWKWILYRGKVVERNKKGVSTRVAGTCSDITEKKLFEEKLRYASTHDQLSGLYNRAYFDAEIARVRAGRNFPVSIVIADVDGMKLVNDSFGHAAGDRLIELAAQALKESFRADDVVARIGGDEFAVVLSNADESVVKEAVKRIVAFQPEPGQCPEHIRLSISVGSATAECAEQLGEALKQADARMYYYKFRRKTGNAVAPLPPCE